MIPIRTARGFRPSLGGLTLLVALGCAATGSPGGGRDEAPSFTASTLQGDGRSFDPTRLERPTLLVFWASW